MLGPSQLSLLPELIQFKLQAINLFFK
jgi:hypothetical protein